MEIQAVGMAVAGGGGDEGLRCTKLSAGGSWKCNLMAIRGELFCEKHILWVHGNTEVEQTGSEEIEGANPGIDVRYLDVGMKSSDLDIGKAIIVHGKKRGRPKGSKNKVKKGDVMIVNDAGIIVRKRGRPKGSKNKIKTKDAVEHDDGISKEDPLVRNDSINSVRKPGRPKGSKNKVKKNLCDDHDVGTSCTKCSGVKDLTVVVKKGVQDENDGEIVVRKIGRPKGSKNKLKKKVCDDPDVGIATNDCIGVGYSNEVKKDGHGGNDGEIVIRKIGRAKGSKNKVKKKVCNDHDVGIACSKCGGVGDTNVVVKKGVHVENDGGAIVRKRGMSIGVKGNKKSGVETEMCSGHVSESEAPKKKKAKLSKDMKTTKKSSVDAARKDKEGYEIMNEGPKKIKSSTNKPKARANASGLRVVGRPQIVAHSRVTMQGRGEKNTNSDALVKKKQKGPMCHQCRKNSMSELIMCSKCKTRQYCSDCIAEWYFGRTKEVEQSCPFCRGNCNCEACLQTDVITKVEVANRNRNQQYMYMLKYILPYLTKIQQVEQTELDIESRMRGNEINEEDVPEAYYEDDDRVYCDNCKTSIFNLHRSCPNKNCSFDICLDCCNELRKGIQPLRRDSSSKTGNADWKANEDGSIACPSKSLGGCGSRNLELRRFQHAAGVNVLIKKAENITCNYKLPYVDFSQGCSSCNAFLMSAQNGTGFSELRQAARRDSSEDNFLYCPNVTDLGDAEFAHFQMHWRKGEPVIVRNAIATAYGLSWEPNVMMKAFKAVAKKLMKRASTVKAIDCWDWCELEISVEEFFKGYSETNGHQNEQRRILKLRDWPPANSFQECLPRYCAEFLAMLPFSDWTHPRHGYLNLATKLPDGAAKPDLGPKIYIAYGHPEDLGRGESVTKLHCDVSDAVNILTHAATEQTGSNGKGAAIWDIFRRQDIEKLTEYLLKHQKEFRHFKNLPLSQVLHPIHDQTFYLDDKHKKQLKEEFDVEPWTFEQHLGEAVFIPAGCPHQVKNIKSCTKVAVDFVSPEGIDECFRLTREFRLLPHGHRSKQDILEVKRLVVSAAKLGVSEIEEFGKK